ncbi:MAG TPA: carboxylate-amine ligase [Hyphomicrobiaceae bacterium]|nr:carboxylate-amine ligase [Hyphomicrobiaceae bacterium]
MQKRAVKRRTSRTVATSPDGHAASAQSSEPAFTFGIEEEYFVIDRASRDLARDLPHPVFDALRAAIGKGFSVEYMRSQIEIATPVLSSAEEAERILVGYRRTIADILRPNGLAPLAVATHPFADWREQKHTDKPRYNQIADTLQGLGRRMLVNGLHVHVGIDDENDRIRVMNGLRGCLPIILALSASSPFWQAEPTGLKSYRIAINDATPRRGIPERFDDWQAYQAEIATMVRAGMIADATHLWWDIRPSARFATVEVRIADVCPRVVDSVAIAVLIRCLARAIWRKADGLEAIAGQSLALINENRWLAQRYGTTNGFIDPASGRVQSFRDVLEALFALLRDDADALDAHAELDHLRDVAASGSSADRQLTIYDSAVAAGHSTAKALRTVVDHLLEETLAPVRSEHLDQLTGTSSWTGFPEAEFPRT